MTRPLPGPDDPIRRIFEAMSTRALARCAELGIDGYDFYLALLEEAKVPPKAKSVVELFERAFRRLEAARN